jgi:hypothetical protein
MRDTAPPNSVGTDCLRTLFLIILLAAAILLLLPLIAMQFSSEVNWTAIDFVVAGTLLLGTGVAIELILRKFRNFIARVGIITAILVAFMLIWAELAVGVFGAPLAGH